MTGKKPPPVSPELRQRTKELRQPLTPAEQKLWRVLRNRNLSGQKFRRQHPIGNYVVDFYCAEIRLVIEIDGDSHAFQEEYDLARTEWLECQDLTVIRYSNRQVMSQPEQVLQDILAQISDAR